MYLIVDTTTDPAWNLAVEEYLLTQRDEPFFRLWRNADSVIMAATRTPTRKSISPMWNGSASRSSGG